MKYLLLLFMMFLLSGCTVQYDLTIDEQNSFLEQVTFQAENLEESEEIQDNTWAIKVDYNDPDLGENPEKIEGVDYYNDQVSINRGYYQRKLTYQHSSLNTLRNSNVVKSCFEHFYVNENASSVTLSTSSEFLCMNEFSNLNSVRVSISLPHKVISHNADEIYENQYIWNIMRENYQEKGLILSFEKLNISSNFVDEPQVEEKKVSIVLIVVLLGLFFLFLIIVFVYNYKQKNHS